MSRLGKTRATLYDLSAAEEMTPEKEAYLFKVSQLQDELFAEIVNEVETHRHDLGLKIYSFYYNIAELPPNKIEKFTNSDIHKFYLSDIVWLLAKCGKKLKLEFVDLDEE